LALLPGASAVVAQTKDLMEKDTSAIFGFTLDPLTRGLAFFWAMAFVLTSAQAQIYVSDEVTDTVKEYNATTGTQITSPFNTISSTDPVALAVSGNALYVDDQTGTIKEYNATTGALITSGFTTISSPYPVALALGASSIYVADDQTGTVKEYSTNGTPITNPFNTISGVLPFALALSSDGSELFVGDLNTNTVKEYSASTGIPVPTFSISSPNILSLAVLGNSLYVGDGSNDNVEEYYASLQGTHAAGSQVAGFSISVGSPALVPEPSSAVLLLCSAVPLLHLRRRGTAV
jgi:DNA-binding beta-propeller fold protein YncE